MNFYLISDIIYNIPDILNKISAIIYDILFHSTYKISMYHIRYIFAILDI